MRPKQVRRYEYTINTMIAFYFSKKVNIFFSIFFFKIEFFFHRAILSDKSILGPKVTVCPEALPQAHKSPESGT